MIAVGKIIKSVGVKGGLRLLMLTDSPDRFGKLKSVWIGTNESTATRHTVRSVRISKTAVLELEEIRSRAEADERRGQFVFVRDKDGVAPGKGAYFIHDIVGMSVVTEAGDPVGTVQEVLSMPANDVWVVVAGTKEHLIPAIKEVIRSVNVGKRMIVIRPMEGLLD